MATITHVGFRYGKRVGIPPKFHVSLQRIK
jgi:hypothetical protein